MTRVDSARWIISREEDGLCDGLHCGRENRDLNHPEASERVREWIWKIVPSLEQRAMSALASLNDGCVFEDVVGVFAQSAETGMSIAVDMFTAIVVGGWGGSSTALTNSSPL